MAGFNTLNAAYKELLQTYMESVLHGPWTGSPGPTPAFSISSTSVKLNSFPVHKESMIQPTAVERRTHCPRQVNISWQLKPPYTLEKNVSGDQPNVDGIFHQVLDFALDNCCAFYGERKPILIYLTVASNTSSLLQNIFNEDVSLVFPIPKVQQISSSRCYINILDSPGVVLIQRKPSYSINRGNDLFRAILGTWPIVLLSILMSCLAGICIWILVSQLLLFRKRFFFFILLSS